MTPFEQALAIYATHPELNLGDDLAMHAACGGYVLATPNCMAMVRPVSTFWHPSFFADISCVATPEHANCWFVWLLAGSLKEAAKHLPYPLPWFGFAQRNEPARFVEAQKVLAKIG